MQSYGTKQGLIASKSRLSKKQLTISRLELVATQMVANIADNIWNSLLSHNVREVYGWSDSTVVMRWLQGHRSNKQFVHKIVKYINSKMPISWRCLDTIQNPADIGSGGSYTENAPEEWCGKKEPFRGVLKNRCSENMQQIYRRTPIPKCDFNKVAKQLYWNRTSAWVFSCKFAAYFKNTCF